MFANGAAAALDAFYCCPVVLTINGGSFCGTLFRALTAAGCEKHFSMREYSVGMHGVAIHATHCQHRIGNQFTEAVRSIRDIVGRVAIIAGGCAARHFFFFYVLLLWFHDGSWDTKKTDTESQLLKSQIGNGSLAV